MKKRRDYFCIILRKSEVDKETLEIVRHSLRVLFDGYSIRLFFGIESAARRVKSLEGEETFSSSGTFAVLPAIIILARVFCLGRSCGHTRLRLFDGYGYIYIRTPCS